MMWGRRYIVHCIAVVGMGSLGVVWCGVVCLAIRITTATYRLVVIHI